MAANGDAREPGSLPALPRGRGGLPREAAAFLQRARILDATVRTVARHGYDKATVSEIQALAGVSRRTFYDAFADKEGAVVDAFDAAAAFAIPQILDAGRRQAGWAARVDAALTTYLALLNCDRDWATLCLVGLPAAGEGAMARRDRVLAPVVAALAPDGGAIAGVKGALAAVNSALRARLADRDRALAEAREELLMLAIAPFAGPTAARRRAAADPAAPRLRGSRASEVTEWLGHDRRASAGELARLVARAADERDGPALWRAVVGLHERRAAGHAVDGDLERRALGGLDGAWPFGLPGVGAGLGGAAGGEDRAWLPATARMRCLRFVCAHPECTAREIRVGMGAPHHSTVYRLLADLRESGLVERRAGVSRAAVWRCTAAGRQLADGADGEAKKS